MSTQLRAFKPLSATVSTAVSTSSSSVTVTRVGGTASVRIANVGTQVIYVTLNGSNPIVSNSIPIMPNTVEIFTVGDGESTVSAIASATGSTMYVTFGEGR